MEYRVHGKGGDFVQAPSSNFNIFRLHHNRNQTETVMNLLKSRNILNIN